MSAAAAAAPRRLALVRERLEALGVDALLVTTPPNRRWLSGFTGSAGVLLVDAVRARIATDGRYHEQAAAQAPAFELVAAPLRSVASFAAALLDGLGGARLGFEPAGLSVAAHGEWVSAIGALPAADRPRPVPAAGAIEPLRAIKDADELAALTEAVRIGDEAWACAAAAVRPGASERAIAWEARRRAHELGAEDMAFDTIVAAGPNGAMAHHRPDATAIGAGQPVVMDLGAVFGGYRSDLTRTICAGEPDDRFRRVHGAVLAAQEMAEERIEAGMTGAQAHAVAAAVLAAAGYGEAFTHGLGHGVGLDIHEAPRLAADSADVLADGQVVTVEPGVYLPGWGGVRIEDQCVIENGRLRVLSRAPKLGPEWGAAS